MSETVVRTPPNNIEAERAVLGSILVDTSTRNGDRIMDLCLSSGISEESFYDPRNRYVFNAMMSLNRASKPLDMITLQEELRVSGNLEAVGGFGYLQAIVDLVPTTAHAEHYIRLVKEKQLRRTLISRATSVIEKSYDEAGYDNPAAILGEAEKSFLEIAGEQTKTMTWSAAVEESMKRINRMFFSAGKKMEGLSTGLTHLDEKLQGLKEAEMIVIAARPSVGKTSLAMNIAESAALGQMLTLKNGVYPPVASDDGKMHPVGIFSLEMPVEALTKRMLSGRAQVNMWNVARGRVLRNERQVYTKNLDASMSALLRAPIFVDDTAGLDIMDLRARARRWKKQHGIELIVIDYLQLCTCREAQRMGSRQIEVSMISQQIKAMAKELKIPVIVLSQLSRANEQRNDKYEKPKLSDLRDSGAIEQDADVVFLLRRPSRTPTDPDSNDKNLAIIDVAKNRNGEIGEVRVNFMSEYTRFEDRPLELKNPDGFETSEPPPEESRPSQAALNVFS